MIPCLGTLSMHSAVVEWKKPEGIMSHAYNTLNSINAVYTIKNNVTINTMLHNPEGYL